MRKVRYHTFNGVKYQLDLYAPFESSCDYPHNKDSTPQISIAVDIDTKEGLIALIHECLHAEQWAATEEVVDRTSIEIGNLLWRLGYRRKRK